MCLRKKSQFRVIIGKMKFKDFMKWNLRVGPWRITRKVLLAVVLFCLVVVCFGALILHFGRFDDDSDDSKVSARFADSQEDDDDDGCVFCRSGSHGSRLLLALMVVAVVILVLASSACFFAQQNSPHHLGTPTEGASVYTVQYDPRLQRATASAPEAPDTGQPPGPTPHPGPHTPLPLLQEKDKESRISSLEDMEDTRGHFSLGLQREPPPPYTP